MKNQISNLIKLNLNIEGLLRTLAERDSEEALDILLDTTECLYDEVNAFVGSRRGCQCDQDSAELDEEAEIEVSEPEVAVEPIVEPEAEVEAETEVETVTETEPEAEVETEEVAEPENEVEPIIEETVAEVEPVAEEEPIVEETEVEKAAVEPETEATEEPTEEPATEPVAEQKVEPVVIDYDSDAIPQNSIKVDEMISRQESLDLRKAFTINDKYRFRRELFNGSDEAFIDTINLITAMSSYDEACEYIYQDLGLSKDNEDVIDFMSIISKHFNALQQ